jgi:hypothetical protein
VADPPLAHLFEHAGVAIHHALILPRETRPALVRTSGEHAEPLLRVPWGEASAIVSFIRLFAGISTDLWRIVATLGAHRLLPDSDVRGAHATVVEGVPHHGSRTLRASDGHTLPHEPNEEHERPTHAYPNPRRLEPEPINEDRRAPRHGDDPGRAKAPRLMRAIHEPWPRRRGHRQRRLTTRPSSSLLLRQVGELQLSPP